MRYYIIAERRSSRKGVCYINVGLVVGVEVQVFMADWLRGCYLCAAVTGGLAGCLAEWLVGSSNTGQFPVNGGYSAW